MNAPNNGAPDQPPQLPVPPVTFLYREVQGGRVLVGVEIAGQRVGGIISANVGLAGNRFPGAPPHALVMELSAIGWPVTWKDATEPELVAATQMPPEPPKGPRIFRG